MIIFGGCVFRKPNRWYDRCFGQRLQLRYPLRRGAGCRFFVAASLLYLPAQVFEQSGNGVIGIKVEQIIEFDGQPHDCSH